MGEFGQVMVYVSMVLSAAGGALVVGGAHRRHLETTGHRLLGAAAWAATVSFLVLVYLLVTHDYRVAYVHEYGNRNMPLGYLVTAVWGGQEGSLLLWAVFQAWFTGALATFGSRRPPFAIGCLALLQTYFFALVLFHSNPFETLGTFEVNGVGMNPLLLNPFMTIHPPTLFLGFVGFSVPFALALGSLAEGHNPDEWIDIARPWILFAWLFLSVGNSVGMVWAYQELGWGGYWGWDPVENASFMPWLTGTALLHTAMSQKQKKLNRILNATLAMVTFVLIIFGTFITRSGVIQSVHTFAGATVGSYLLGLIVFSIAAFAYLVLIRKKTLDIEPPSLSSLSRENLLYLTSWILIFCAAFVWIGTMAPLFTELFKGEKVASTPELFNRWMVPLGLLLLAVLGVCSLLARRARIKSWIVHLSAAVLAAGAATSFFGWRSPYALLSFGLVGLSVAAAVRELIRVMRGFSDASGLNASRRRRLGAHIVHLSVAVMFLGFTGSAYTVESSKLLSPNESMKVSHYDITFLGLRDETDYSRAARFADLRVRQEGRPVGLFSAARMFFHSHPKQPTSEVDIRTTLREDLFLILGNTDEEGGAVIRAVVNPLVVWIWIGGVLLVIGALVSLTPKLRLKGVSIDTVKRRLVSLGIPAVTSVLLFSVTWSLKGLATAIAAAAGLGLIGVVLLLGQSLLGLAEPEEGK
jgi:cytochrome c-type biogenesis protein CcmF